MKKKLSLLLAGTMTLSLLLSACGRQAEARTAEPSAAPSASAQPAAEPSAAPTPEETASVQSARPSQADAASAAPAEEPSEAAQGGAVISAPPQSAAPAAVSTPKPAVSTPKPAVSAPAPATPASGTPAPAENTPQPTQEPTPEPTPEPAAETPQPAATKEAAAAFIGQSVSSMIAAIGQPNGRDYAPSCLGEGEDGELFYNGFTVYTYREGNTETVQDVI